MKTRFLIILFFLLSLSLEAKQDPSLKPPDIELESQNKIIPEGSFILPICNFDIGSKECEDQWEDFSVRHTEDIPIEDPEELSPSKETPATPKLKPKNH